MKINDIYGEFYVDQMIADIINSKIFKRLKKVHQGGAGYLVNECWNVTRYDHSIGSMFLAKKMGGSQQDQILSLLHDVSHTAFSHVIDYILDNDNENYHDNIWMDTIINSEIPSILKRYEIESDFLFNTNYFALEANLPSLSIDRIDYTLRDMYHQKIITLSEVNKFLSSLSIYNQTICVNSIKMAEWFQRLYYKEVIGYFKNPLNIYANEKLTEILRASLKEEIIKIEDFLLTDDQLLEKIKRSKNNDLKTQLFELENTRNLRHLDITNNLKIKARIIDPDVLIDNKIYKLTELSDSSKKINDDIMRTT